MCLAEHLFIYYLVVQIKVQLVVHAGSLGLVTTVLLHTVGFCAVVANLSNVATDHLLDFSNKEVKLHQSIFR